MSEARVLIANRGEIAMRIMRSARELGYATVVSHSADDANTLWVRKADQAVEIPGRGVAAYLDAQAIVAAATAAGCSAIHPGYGFLAEQASFAELAEAAGLQFVGPTPEVLALFGDKLAARARALACGIPVLEASPDLSDAKALLAYHADHGQVILKAAGGGGGRGMRIISPADDAATLFEQARAEAQAAFGDPRIYAEAYIANARHIEVQIVGDGQGQVTHLWERDCSLQRRHQKLIEIAPAPALAASTRQALLDAACELAAAVNYRGLGTFEFLLDGDSEKFYFIEANARLQVEHTVTEQILGLDLVAAQLKIAAGETLEQLDLLTTPPIQGYAMQLRINAETLDETGAVRAAGGTLSRFDPAAGPGIRIDSAAAPGYVVHPAFDSLLAKLIVHAPSGGFAALLGRASRAAAEFSIVGTETNLPMLSALLAEPAMADYRVNTAFIGEHAAHLAKAASHYIDEPGDLDNAAPATRGAVQVAVPDGMHGVSAPMRGSVVECHAEVGDNVTRGQLLVLLEAMKMHHEILAPVSGSLLELRAELHEVVDEAEIIAVIKPDSVQDDSAELGVEMDLERSRADLDEVIARHALGLDENRPESVAKRRRFGNRTARENIADLCDPDSFIEYGALANAAQRRRRSLDDLRANTPADGMVAGFGTVNAGYFGEEAARCAVLAYDYTVLAGTQGHTNHKKKDRLFELAAEHQSPVVFFTEGGGGRPGDVDTDDIYMAWLDIKTFATWPQLSGIAPRIAVNSGRCYAGNAVIFGCADITIATKNSNIGLAGPAMIEGGGLGKFTPEDIGPIEVQTANGVVDIACEDELEATAIARSVLGCFQGRLPEWTAGDQRRLRHLIPEDRLRVYDIRAVIEAMADEGSVIELRRDYGVGMVTALIRVEGHAFGLIANDPRHLGGAIDSDGGEKGGRFLQLCDHFGLPVVSLCDTPGYMVGPDSEKTAAVRRGSRLIVASANLSVPLFTIVVRKGYGLGAQAMAGGSFHQPFFTIAWPTAEMGPMGLEGAVELGFRKELEATEDKAAREALFQQLVGGMYEKGKAVSVASVFEIDAVIDPAETRSWLVRGVRAAGKRKGRARGYVDVW